MDSLSMLHGDRAVPNLLFCAVVREHLRRRNMPPEQPAPLWEDLARCSFFQGLTDRAYMVLADDGGVLAVYDVTDAHYERENIVGIIEVEDTDTIAAVLASK